MTVRVRLLGRPRLADEDGQPRQPPRGQKSWALLARLALADRPLSRSELAAELFAEADDPLGALRWSLADLRRCFDDPRLMRGDPVDLADDSLWIDVRALNEGSLPAGEIDGELLHGVEPRNCPAFDVWLILARGRCAARSMEELRQATLRLLATGDFEAAADVAGRAAARDPLDEGAQELFLRALVSAGHPARAGTAALDAGSVDAGIETLRRAAEESERSDDPLLQADVLRTLGAALVHAIRGFDGEGAVILHRALLGARAVGSKSLTADILRELAFVDVQAGRHGLAARALREAATHARAADDPVLTAGILAIRGMNEADQGHHDQAVELLGDSARTAAAAGSSRQEAWSTGVMARSLLLSGEAARAMAAAERSILLCEQERWNAFLPWPQSIRAHSLAADGRWSDANDDAEQAFALACQLGDPCWEGMAGRALALLASHQGDGEAASEWIIDARRRCDRLPDRYVWVSCFVGLGQLEIATRHRPDLVLPLARRLHSDALRTDLPEFAAWALVHQAEAGDRANLALVQSLASQVTNPALLARAAALG
jgi:DNA-binding SARP family transcriptional activator